MAFIHIDGGQQSARFLVDGKEVWVGRSRNGHFLKRLFATEAEALLAGDDEDAAQAPPDLQAEELELFVVQSPEDEEFLLLRDEHNKSFWDELFLYETTDVDSIRDLQAVLDRINPEEPNVSSHPGSR